MQVRKKKDIEREEFIYDGAIDQGLEGIVACRTAISTILDGNLYYRGYGIQDLSENSSFEEVVFLLWNNRLPTLQELKAFKEKLNSFLILDQDLLRGLRSLPTQNVHPMSWLRTAISYLALFEENKRDRGEGHEIENQSQKRMEAAFNLTAKVGQLVALFERIRNKEDYISPQIDKSLAWNFHYCFSGKEPDSRVVDIFDKCLILHADHELNCSTFSIRVTSSTLSDVYSAIVSAIGTLKGPLHGGANEQVMRTLESIGRVENVTGWLRKALSQKKKIMGFGHRVYKDGDPRAHVLKEMSKSLTKRMSQYKWFEISEKLEQEVRMSKNLLPNVDFYSATVYYAMGIPLDLFTPIFATARIGGWFAHIFEQHVNNRIYRPRAEWVGGSILKWVPFGKR